ncbi:MAG: hypothetical protein OEZ13_04345 [Spirochaetia bacterium]|nr:hypothetical protein [Spirochaetia bacterium]
MKIFYDEKMSAKTNSFSPSSEKPRKLAERAKPFHKYFQFEKVIPLAWEDFLLSHSEEYVYGIKNLSQTNGFWNTDKAIRDTLPYTSGSLFSAAKEALASKIAWAFCSGFHHAHKDSGGGFCTFDGLTVSAKKLLNENKVQNVFILDGDAHFGDGTSANITGEWREKISYRHTGGSFFTKNKLKKWLLQNRPGIIFFQDGMDSYRFDPIGGGLTYKQLYERCHIVCETAREMNIPLVINLAGGYLRVKQADKIDELEPVLLGHMNSLFTSVGVYETPEAFELVDLSEKFWEKSKIHKAC